MRQREQQEQECSAQERVSLCASLRDRPETVTQMLLHGELDIIPFQCPRGTVMTPEDRALVPLRNTPPSHSSEGRHRIRRTCLLIGSFIGVSLSAYFVVKHLQLPSACLKGGCDGPANAWLSLRKTWPRNLSDGTHILKYLDLFGFSRPPSDSDNTTIPNRENRNLLGSISSSNDPSRDPQLVIAGKMTIDDGTANIGQYNLKTKEWSLTERIQLSLYNSYSGGEVYSLLANHTFLTSGDSESSDDDSTKR